MMGAAARSSSISGCLWTPRSISFWSGSPVSMLQVMRNSHCLAWGGLTIVTCVWPVVVHLKGRQRCGPPAPLPCKIPMKGKNFRHSPPWLLAASPYFHVLNCSILIQNRGKLKKPVKKDLEEVRKGPVYLINPTSWTIFQCSFHMKSSHQSIVLKQDSLPSPPKKYNSAFLW